MNTCSTCGGPKPSYSPEFVKLWETAMRWFPLLALPEVAACADCLLFKAGRRPSTPGYRDIRAAWLQSGTPLPTLDLKDPTVAAGLRKGKRALKRYRKLIQAQRDKKRKLWMRRAMKKINKVLKKRNAAIMEVLERAAED